MEKPLHVRVAEALGCQTRQAYSQWDCGCPDRAHSEHKIRDACDSHSGLSCDFDVLSRYDTDWSATGPLIERFSIALRPPNEPERVGQYWEAYAWVYPEGWDGKQYHDVEEITKGDRSALVAVCKLILALSEAGKLR